MTDGLVWVDIETTGLDQGFDAILEIAVVVTDMRYQVFYSESFLVWNPDALTMSDVDPFVLYMHTKSDLWNALKVSTIHERTYGEGLSAVESSLVKALNEVKDANGFEKLYPAGSSIHFDLSFIRNDMPDFYKLLNHRHYDISSIKLFMATVLGELPTLSEPFTPIHRALPDVLNSIHHAKCLAEPWTMDIVDEAPEDFSLQVAHTRKVIDGV